MGKASQGVFGMWSGRVGNVVGRIRQGRNIYAIYQPNVSDRNSLAQQQVRSPFGIFAKFFSTVSGFISMTFHDLDGYKYGTYFSSAIGYNMQRRATTLTGTFPTQSIDYTNVVLSQGTVDLPYNPAATLSSGTVTVTWADNSGRGNALDDDAIMILAYNTVKEQSVYDSNAAMRTARTGVLTLPTAWTGDTVEVYVAVRRPDTGECSPSAHLLSTTVA